MKCFVWRVVLYGAKTWTLRRNEQKRLGAFEMWIWRRMDLVIWTDKRKKCSCAGKSGRRMNNAGTYKKRKINWLAHWRMRNCLLKDALKGMVNGKKLRGRRRYQMIDKIMINGLYADTKRKAEKMVEWRMLNLQWKTCPRVGHYDWLIAW